MILGLYVNENYYINTWNGNYYWFKLHSNFYKHLCLIVIREYFFPFIAWREKPYDPKLKLIYHLNIISVITYVS